MRGDNPSADLALESSDRFGPGDTLDRDSAPGDVPGDSFGDSPSGTFSGVVPPSKLFSGAFVSEFARARKRWGRRRPLSSTAGTRPETLLRRPFALVAGYADVSGGRCCRSRHIRALLIGVSCLADCGALVLGGVCISRAGATSIGGDCSRVGGGEGSRAPVARRSTADMLFLLGASWYRGCCGACTGSSSSPADVCDEIAARSDAAGLTAFSNMLGRLGRFESRQGGDAVLLRSCAGAVLDERGITCMSAGDTLGVDLSDAVGLDTWENEPDDAAEPVRGLSRGYPVSLNIGTLPHEISGT